jgi:riboflavin kinase / FMN adenylyltransferase
MKFSSTQIKGKGRGKLLGYPTINLEIPEALELEDGIYAVIVYTEIRKFSGALHYGPIPTFNETEKTLEVFLIDTSEGDIPQATMFDVEIVQFIRPVLKFSTQKELSDQISKDVEDVRKFLNF